MDSTQIRQVLKELSERESVENVVVLDHSGHVLDKIGNAWNERTEGIVASIANRALQLGTNPAISISTSDSTYTIHQKQGIIVAWIRPNKST